ncbi:MAG: c-type cytochrome biogenesis protein CcmI [Candidatus Marinimicrobia bacterium]|nr:c-type cytochrome biogenesis protein CcmI [Candidatus Neomarinimicrobiota bacterium]MDP6500743.1 c-type cytochrome biogenesis protein CcmI [Candidatus Neomarinimicrobiota bacterium]MDP6725783.1 c-type cytochrome biogenesis protein CcmI [Candidatus Neomarinimicrobiota bacterium]|tara:strand:- start:3867 stop:4133 length:267 start_codon:yes stop_codon:yes gene_type:complete
MISVVVTFLIIVVMAVFVIQPLFLEPGLEIKDTEKKSVALKQRKKILYRQIKELDMDYQLGNIQDDDYGQTRNELKKEVAEILTILNR